MGDWEDAAKQFKGGGQAQAGESAPDWKVWNQAPETEQPKEGFLRSLGDSFGMSPDATQPSLKDMLTDAVIGPAGTAAKSLYAGGKRIGSEIGKAYDAGKEGNSAGVAVHSIAALPFVGQALDKGADQYNAGDIGGEIGTALGGSMQIAPLVEGATGSPVGKLLDMVPTKAQGGAMLDQVAAKVGKSPVAMTRTLPAIESAQRLSDYGHGTITPLDKLYQRMQTINPIDYEEARGRYTPLTRLTANDKMNATPQLKGAAGATAKALREDIGDTARAHSDELGDLYEKGMTTFARAARLNDLVKNTGKVAGGAAAAGAIGYPLYNKLKALIP